MVMKKPPVTISLSGRVPGRASEPSRDGFGDGGRDGTFRGFWLGCLGFSRDEEYIGGRATSVEPRGAHTMPRRGQGGPAPRGGVAASRLCFVSPSDSVFVTQK